MDESGCLGFDFKKAATSQYFVITFLFAENKRHLEKIIRSIFKNMDEKSRKRHCGVLHASKETPEIRFKLLNQLQQKSGVHIMVIRLNKKKVYTHLQDEKSVLYNYITNILLDRIINKKIIFPIGSIRFIASRRETNKFLNMNFKSYLERQVKGKLNIEIAIDTPAHEKCLQVVDCVSWSVFRYYEKNDDTYYNTIKHLIVEDNSLF